MNTHVMPPTFKVVVAICAGGVLSDSPDCPEPASANLAYEGAIAISRESPVAWRRICSVSVPVYESGRVSMPGIAVTIGRKQTSVMIVCVKIDIRLGVEKR
jgi:hypothetical protein